MKAKPDPTQAAEAIIALAYEAVKATPPQEQYRRNEHKKNENPALTAPMLNRVITHWARRDSFTWAHKKARAIVITEAAGRYVDSIQSAAELSAFLATLSLFARTTQTKDQAAMDAYQDRSNHRLTQDAVIERAYRIVREIAWDSEWNANKLVRLVGRLRAARTKWECLAVLAQYYPLRGVAKPLINRLVHELEELDLRSYQALTGEMLVFYTANKQDARL